MNSSHLHIPRWVATLVVVTAVIAGGILAIGLKNWTGRDVFGAPKLAVRLAGDPAPVPLGNFTNGFASVLKPALPAVVNIHSSKVVKTRPQMMPFLTIRCFGNSLANSSAQTSLSPNASRAWAP